jgi:stage II sporulation protein AA (anti-sigma F factor antagonist)
MHLAFYRNPVCVIAEVSGELDLSAAGSFRDRVDQELSRTGSPNLVLNLQKLDFIDSTGLGALLGRHRQVTASGGKFILAGPPPKVMSMIEMAGLSSVLKIVRSQEDALRLLGGAIS